jgi:undecaprenyl-phosphate 4-deoxy-4-formamido-L-arabinose transferase
LESLDVGERFLAGVQLMMLGLIGEYLGRLYLTANRKPQSVIKEVTRSPAGEAWRQADDRSAALSLRRG